jgi:hypothetical protein
MPNNGNSLDKSVAVDRDAQLSECIYYQWDTLQQRLHVIQKRALPLSKTVPINGFDQMTYMCYIINARGQFDSTVRENFDMKIF